MGWKGNLVDLPLGIAARLLTPPRAPAESPASIFILRNNAIGDLLVTTPLFDALRRRFPAARITAGVGKWGLDVIRHNPHLSNVMEVNAPWNNEYSAEKGWGTVFSYLARSPEVLAVRRRRFDVGIDVLGSHVGSVFMLRTGIPRRFGVRGFRGGHTATEGYVVYDANEHVGRSALRFAEMLGATDLPPVRPQIFLTTEELAEGDGRWSEGERGSGRQLRVLFGIGAGFPEKAWPQDRFAALADRLYSARHANVALSGGTSERDVGEVIASSREWVSNFAGTLTLRQSFALTAAADAVVTNPSMLMHVAAAFHKPTVVVLGKYFESARQHDAQWGYPGTCISLGRDAGHSARAGPDEVLATLASLI